MTNTKLFPDYVFETSWEVCNKVGGIYTVLSSRAQTLHNKIGDHLVFIGPDVAPQSNTLFTPDAALCPDWQQALQAAGVKARIGRWNVPGEPIVVLVDFLPLFAERDAIYAHCWDSFGVDSLHAYGDYDEASMFSVAAGRAAEAIIKTCLPKEAKVVYQAHEWMSGLGMMLLKEALPKVATIFTTHATSIGRSICGNNKNLYQYFSAYDGDQMAEELSMQSKHSVEKQSAHRADCFTTVSTFTARECAQLLQKDADVVLPNGFESDFVPKGAAFTSKRRAARRLIFKVVEALTGQEVNDDAIIVSTSGRNDFRCKGFDVYLEALAQLNARLKGRYRTNDGALPTTKVVALIEVPCWTLQPRRDLQLRLALKQPERDALPNPIITHDLHNFYEDRIVASIHQVGLANTPEDPVKVVLVPTYLDGNDGIFNVHYYDLLTANDLSIYPSYYEPWGYTPLESCAFHTPCITTDLSGFGQWVNATLGHAGTLEDGVCVLERNDSNYFQAAAEICHSVERFLSLQQKDRTAVRKHATDLAARAEWKNFISHYFDAYAFALARVGEKDK